jgi:class 3 adenylate cyclase
VIRSFDEGDERRAFSGGFLDLIANGAMTFGRETLDPGWKWSKDVRPIAGTERCEYHHVGYQVSGRWIVEDRDGTQIEVRPGDIFDTPPGHDAWVVGEEPCVTIDFQGIADWAARGTPHRLLTTVLFVDIVDSTGVMARIGDAAWRGLKAQYDERVSVSLAEHGGTLLDTSGDGAFARFDSPGGAVRAARAIVTAGDRIGLPTRAGVHTGEVELKESGVTGMAVHVGARVMAQAGAGEVLVSATTRDLTLDAGMDYDERGAFELKGVTGPRILFAVRS